MDAKMIDAETKEQIDGYFDYESQPTKFDLLMQQRRQMVKNERMSHPVVQQFLVQGPLTPMYNKYWDKLSDTIMFPPPMNSSSNSNSDHMNNFSLKSSANAQEDDMKSIATTLDSIFSLQEDSTLKSRMSDKLTGHWVALEKIFYIQIRKFVEAIENNKSLTLERMLNEEEALHQKAICKNLA